MELPKLTPFTTANSLRFQCSITSEYSEPVALEGTLRRPGNRDVFWYGRLGTVALEGRGEKVFNGSINDLHPDLWSPASPALYDFTVSARSASGHLAEKTVRLGFRSFESHNGQFRLNGRPIFLRGLAINPPGRTIPPEAGESRQFAEAYVRFLKSQNVNIIRMTYDSQNWFDVCDELGMMVYQGQYGSPLGAAARKQEPPADFDDSIRQYKDLFSTYARHPSILIYILSNELPTAGKRGAAFHDYLTRACETLKAWDPTRLYIGNAGYGEGREGDICDVHRYWGWYYNTFLTYYNLRDSPFGNPAKNQPITFTECVGNFTGWNGEYNIIEKKQLGAQLNWTGHSGNQAADATAYQCFMLKQAAETFRRLRPLNPRLCGLMPFTILFDNWSGITNFEQMHAKPAMAQLATSYQPILLSWELWTPQVYAGATIHPIAHVINDSDAATSLEGATLFYSLAPAAQPIGLSGASTDRNVRAPAIQSVAEPGSYHLPPIPYYSTYRQPVRLKVPTRVPTGDYLLRGEIRIGQKVISHNEEPLFIANKKSCQSPEESATDSSILLFDSTGQTVSALRKLRVSFSTINANQLADKLAGSERQIQSAANRGAARLLVIAEDSWSPSLSSQKQCLADFVKSGNRLLILRQNPTNFDTSILPDAITFFTASPHGLTYPPASRPFRANMNVNPERPDHALFRGLDRSRLALWSDYTGWDQTRPGFPENYPVGLGFKFNSPSALAHTAILADYDRGLEGVALAEIFLGKGSILLCGLNLLPRIGLDPAADRLLANLVHYSLSSEPHHVHPFIDSPIEWGNYASERGLVTGPVNGLVLNADWVQPPTNPNARPLSQSEGAWNTRPGDLFLPHGRRLLGPYGYSTGSSLHALDPDSKTATGFFYAEIPSDRSRMVTKIENRGAQPADLEISVNDSKAAHAKIPPHQTVSAATPIPENTTSIAVRFKGTKDLVLYSTAFE